MSENEANIQKKRTTALKIIVDEQICNDENRTREFMSKVFDIPFLLEKKEAIRRTCSVRKGDRQCTVDIEQPFADALISSGLDISKLPDYKEESSTKYTHQLYTTGDHIRKVVGASEDTDIRFEYTSSQTMNNVKTFYILFSLSTNGKTKTEIKGKHKENVSKLLHYLRLNAIPSIYDCEWSFTGNRACQL